MRDEVSDEEAGESVRALDGLPVVPATKFANWEPHYVLQVNDAPEKQKFSLGEVELRFLQLVIATPGKPSSVYAKLVGVSGRRAIEIRKNLVARGFLREHEVATAARGRHSILLEPTEAAVTAAAAGGAA